MDRTLSPGMQVLALKLQEAGMMHGDVRARLQDAISDAHRGTGNYGYYIDHNGDGDSGDVVYSCSGDMRMCSYEMGSSNGNAVTNLDMDNSKNVVPSTSYQEEADDDDHYASMEESYKRDGLYKALPLYERFISKKERDAASEDDFAGKGKSFPILQPGDVQAAVHAMGRAGDKNVGTSTLKSRIIAIAKKKGWTKYLPKAWQGGDAKESKKVSHGTLALIEGASTLEQIVLREAKADYEIKLIAPGRGSSAFYPKEVLQRDGPKVFTAGTHVYLNHPTAAEEAARPEGDIKNLAGVLTTGAAYNESHAKGPGLYARMKVFADHAQTVEEKAPHVGMSIRASGVAESGKQKDGLPVLKELTSAESVDVVTKAGAGGMILTESARTQEEVSDMDAVALQKLQESLNAGLASLALREARADAREMAMKLLESVSLPEAAKSDVISRVLESVPMKDDHLDEVKFKESVNAESQRIGKLISAVTGGGKVHGLGLVGTTELTEAQQEAQRKEEKRQRKEAKRLQESEADVFASITGLPKREVA